MILTPCDEKVDLYKMVKEETRAWIKKLNGAQCPLRVLDDILLARSPPGSRICRSCEKAFNLKCPKWCCPCAERKIWQDAMFHSMEMCNVCYGCGFVTGLTEYQFVRRVRGQQGYCTDCWVKWWDEIYPLEPGTLASRR
jgi:hypothetical protein